MSQTSLFPEPDTAPAPTTPAPRPEAAGRDPEDVRRLAYEALAAHAGDLARLRRAASGYFHQLADGKTYPRQPALKITVPAPAQTPEEIKSKLVVHPRFLEQGWGPNRRVTVDADTIHLVLIRLDPTGRGTVRMKERIDIRLNPDGTHRVGRLYLADGDADAERVCRTVAKFLVDPAACIAESGTHCGICCKALTDPTSRSRGIGPECHARWGDFLHHLVWMDPAPDSAN